MPDLLRPRHAPPSRTEDRLSAEQPQPPAQRRGRLFWVRLPAVILLAGSLWMLRAFFGQARFRISQVVVEGTRLLTAAQVQQVLSLEQQSAFRVDPAQLEARLKEAFPIVIGARVRGELPDKVTVRVAERSDVLVWESVGRTWWVDATGLVLGPVEQPQGLLVLHDVGGLAQEPGDRIAAVPWALAWGMVQAMPAIRSLDYDRDKGLIAHVTPDRWPVYLGTDGDPRVKATIMGALAQQLVDRGISAEYIDLRNERRPVYKRR